MKENLTKLKKLTHELAEGLVIDEEHPGCAYETITTIMDFAPLLCHIVSSDYRLLYTNPFTKKYAEGISSQFGISGDEESSTCFKKLWGKQKVCDGCLVAKVIESGSITKDVWECPVGVRFDVIAIPFRNNGTVAVLLMAVEVHDEQ